jgi:hypothetical protein
MPLLLWEHAINLTATMPLLLWEHAINLTATIPLLLWEHAINLTATMPLLLWEHAINLTATMPLLLWEHAIDLIAMISRDAKASSACFIGSACRLVKCRETDIDCCLLILNMIQRKHLMTKL